MVRLIFFIQTIIEMGFNPLTLTMDLRRYATENR